MYWPKEIDQIIIKYKETEDQSLFNNHIYPALSALALALINTYRANIERDDLISHLWLAIRVYKPSPSQSSYSYFSAVGRHYFSALSNPKYNVEEWDPESDTTIVNPPNFKSASKIPEILGSIQPSTKRDKELLKAISKIQAFDGSKREILKELRRLTGLNTKQMSTILKSFREQYNQYNNKTKEEF